MSIRSKKSIFSQMMLIIGIVVVVNVLADLFFFRLDFTADKIYTLSTATKDILRSLDEPITVTAYFTEDMPQQLLKARIDFKDMLKEYSTVAGDNLVYEFIDPNVSTEQEQKAMQEGIMPSIVNVRERDEMTQKRVFLGAVLKMGNKKEIIPIIQTGTAMEYELSTAVKKLSITNKPMLGYLQGHGEPSPQALQQVMAELDVLYDVRPINLDDTNTNLMAFNLIAIVGPTDTIPAEHLRVLDNFLARGGNLFIAYNRVKGDLSTVQGTSIYTGMENWLRNKGLLIDNSFLIDIDCGSVGVQQQSGFMNFTTNVKFPYLPVIHNFADHPVTRGLEQVILPFASSINYTGTDTTAGIQYTPLAFSSDKSGTQAVPLYFDVNKKWAESDFPLQRLTVAGLLSGKINGDVESKILLVGDADFPVSGEGQRPQQLQPDNVNLMVNSIEWLSDQTGLIDLRTKAITARPLDTIEDGRKAFLKWLNFLLPIFTVIIFGFVWNQRNRRIKMKRMEEGYV
jgi:gliding-associated putative ABC transporter substrate-binding component GldG